MSRPHLTVRGLVVGTKGAEYVGQVAVSCAETGLTCKINFKAMGVLGLYGGWDQVEGEVKTASSKRALFTLHGRWSDKVFLTEATVKKKDAKQVLFYDYAKTEELHRPELIPREPSHSMESQRVWERVVAALDAKDYDAAAAAKAAVEQAQREKAAQFKELGCEHITTFFAPDGKGGYTFQEALEDAVLPPPAAAEPATAQ